MVIIVSENGEGAKKIQKSRFESEKNLQDYLRENPDIVPVDDIEEGVRLLPLAREFPTGVGPIDMVGIDQGGRMYLIETKLYANPDKRRVVAQVLDYGASLWKNYDLGGFQEDLANQANKDADVGMTERIQDFFQIDGQEANTIMENVWKNIEAGNFRFVVLMDQVHDDLKNLILFLNQNSNFDIFAVEIEYYKYHNNEIIIPKLFGGRVRKSPHRPVERGVYNENHHLDGQSNEMKELYGQFKKKIESFGDDVKVIPTKMYIAFRRNDNFVYVKLQKAGIAAVINMKKGQLNDPENLAEDVSDKGKHGRGDYKRMIKNERDLEKTIPLIEQSYRQH